MTAALPAWSQDGAPITYAREDPAAIQTAEACRECHASEFEVWRKTPHAKGFKSLHRKESAAAIAEKMGVKLIKRDSLCLTCHYTPILKGESVRAVSGVSCESCHGAGEPWINVHNDYGGKGFTFENETPEHKAARIEQSRELGMRRPSDLYPVASRCFQCHTVPEERLVNVGGHGTGSADFELADRVEQIRHNFLQSFLTGDGTVNAPQTTVRQRLLYVLGRALDMEYSLRGVAVAKEKKRYFKAMSRRVRTAAGEVRAIQARIDAPELAEALDVVRKAKVLPNREQELLAAADRIGEALKRFLARSDGSDLAAVDLLMLGLETGEPEPAVADVEPEPASEPVANPTSPGETAANPAPAGEPVTAPSSASTAADSPQPVARPTVAAKRARAVQIAGEFKRYVRPRSPHKTIGPGKCGSCHRHETQSVWWFDDPHFASADPFFEQNPKNVKIAKLYGLSATKMARGDNICMDCHGTVVSGKERREVADGVSCESCHGPAGSYLEPHQEGDAALGDQRPGYLEALKLGMVKVSDGAVAADRCAQCHYIVEERLLSAGHPSGSKFDYAAGMAKTKHWERPLASADALASAYAAVLAKRGPIPQVQAAALIEEPTPAAAASATSTGTATSPTPAATPTTTAGDSRPARQPGRRATPPPPKPRPATPIPAARSGQKLALPPFPDIDSSTSTEEALRLLKQRLELLHRLVHGPENSNSDRQP